MKEYVNIWYNVVIIDFTHMRNQKKYIPWKLHGISNKGLLAFYDFPRNTEIRDCRKEKFNLNFPDNSLVLLTHGTFAVNSDIRKTMNWTNRQVYRLLKNYSDFWTRKAIKSSWIPDESIVHNKTSRMTWDSNRWLDAVDFIRAADFSWNKLLDNPSDFRSEWEKRHREYHDEVTIQMQEKQDKNWWVIWFDIHDTWIRLMWKDKEYDKFREEWFPPITLWTRDWEACNDDILDFFSNRLEYHIWIKPLLNEPYKWGYVTQRHWEQYRINNNTRKRNLIQIELGRFLYLKESTQEVDWERMEIIWEWLKRAIAETWTKFGKEYFEWLE